MSFDYPSSEQSVLKGQDFYRIRAPISVLSGGSKVTTPQNFSIGDLAPIRSPLTGIAVGPDSDFYRYEISYPDQLSPSGINTVALSPVNPFIAAAGVNLAGEEKGFYKDTSQLQEIFVRALDWLPVSSNVVQPLIDLIIYTTKPPTVYPTTRNPKRFTIPLELDDAVDSVLRIPVSGRQEASLRLSRSGLAGAAISWSIEGNILFGYTAGFPLSQRFELLPSTAIPAGVLPPFGDGLFVYDPQTHGYFDELVIRVSSDTDHDPSDSDGAPFDVVFDAQLRD